MLLIWIQFSILLQGSIPSMGDHTLSTVGVVGGPMSHLLEQNYLILNQYKQNMQQYKVNENTSLLVQFRDNILTILNQMSCMTGLMQHMPDLPVRLNEDLANSFLPKATNGLYGPNGQPLLASAHCTTSLHPHRHVLHMSTQSCSYLNQSSLLLFGPIISPCIRGCCFADFSHS